MKSCAPTSPIAKAEERDTARGWSARILLVCALANAAPLLLAKHLPFCDLPEHVAAIAVLRHYWDPEWQLSKYFFVQDPTRTPYLLYDAIAALLAVPLGSAERANLLLLLATALGFPYALRELLRATHRDQRLALFACPLFWSRALGEGLLSYVAALPVAVWSLALVARQSEAPTRRRAVALSVLALALLYLHAGTCPIFFGGAALLMMGVPTTTASQRGSRYQLLHRLGRLPAQLSWLAPSVVAALVLFLRSSITHPDPASEGVHAGVVRFTSNSILLRSLLRWMYDFWRSPIDDWGGAILWAILFVLAVRRPPPAATAASSAARMAPLLTLLVVVTYFAIPNQVGFAFILALRLAPFVGLVAPLVVVTRKDRVTDGLFVIMAVVSLGMSAHAGWQVWHFEREEAASFDRVMAGLPRGKKLLSLMFNRDSQRANVATFLHFGSYYTARYGGVSSFSFAEVPYWPIQFRPESAPPKKRVVFWDWSPCLFRNSVDGPYYDFVLVRGELNPFANAPPGPTWRVIGLSREWTLYEKTGTGPLGDQRADAGPCAAP